MTDRDLAAAAWAELAKTTDSYPAWVKKGRPVSSHWAKAKGLLDQIGAAAPPPPPTAGKLIGFATGAGPDTYTGMDAAGRARYLDAVLAVGGNVIRFDCVGDAHELSLFQDAHARGIEIIPLVMAIAGPATYAARARAVATMAKPFGVTRYELGNEVNLHLDQYGYPEDWTVTSNAAYNAIKLVQPDAQVSTSGIAAYGQYGTQDAAHMDMQLWFERAVAAGIKFDAVAVHPYHYVLPPNAQQATAAYLLDLTVPYNGYAQTVSLPHSILATLGPGSKVPVWITEAGVPTSSAGWADGYTEQVVADYLTGLIGRVRAEPRIEVCCIYSLLDYKAFAATREGGFGLFRADWTAKPAVGAFHAAVT